MPVKARTVTYETLELYHPTVSCHSEKKDKVKNLQRFHEIAPSDAIFRQRALKKSLSTRVTNQPIRQKSPLLARVANHTIKLGFDNVTVCQIF